jgi:hypothetical protein
MPVEQVVDLFRLPSGGCPPTPHEIREALPRGWVLDEDGVTAQSDARLLFKEGWVLIVGLVCFGAAVIGLFYFTFPRGGAGWLRVAILIGLVVIAGGLVAPIITRALTRR